MKEVYVTVLIRNKAKEKFYLYVSNEKIKSKNFSIFSGSFRKLQAQKIMSSKVLNFPRQCFFFCFHHLLFINSSNVIKILGCYKYYATEQQHNGKFDTAINYIAFVNFVALYFLANERKRDT